MTKGADGIWETAVVPDFAAHEGLPYMYRITTAQGRTVYRTDIFSRQQIGRGTQNPRGGHWGGDPSGLDGTKSCSLIVSLDTVARDIASPAGPRAARIPEAEFWAHEFTPGLPVPSRVEDMVIYELHVGALGFGKAGPGTLEDAIALLPHLSDLGVNAVELLPMSEFSGIGWGYGDSHHFVIESTAGGRDQYKHFVRACHFMAEEVGGQKPYRYDTFMANREDIAGERAGTGARLFRFYQDAIRFSRRHRAARGRSIDIIHVNDDGRVIAFRRSAGSDELLVVASLNNRVFDTYVIQTDAGRLPDGQWRELFNSDAAIYGGNNVGNLGADLPAGGGRLQLRIPANAVLILQKT
jgi:1,4-alpha-glucan branching enzyme